MQDLNVSSKLECGSGQNTYAPNAPNALNDPALRMTILRSATIVTEAGAGMRSFRKSWPVISAQSR